MQIPTVWRIPLRAFAYFTMITLGLGLIAGCSAIPATQPLANIPISLANLAVAPGNTFVKIPVDLSADPDWTQNAGHISGFDSIALTMATVNDTGSDVQLRYYVSDESNLTTGTLSAATSLLTAAIPVGSIQYDSGFAPLTSEAARTISDGRFFLYVSGSPDNITLRTSNTHLTVKVRVSVI